MSEPAANASSPASASRGGDWFGFAIGPLFFALAAWFLFGPQLTDIPSVDPAQVSRERLSTAPRREIVGDPPAIEIGGFKRTCGDCHALFPLGEAPRSPRLQHAHVELDHGINDQCRNCHDPRDMNQLVLYSGESIPYSQVTSLCQKCHGVTHRDWQRGIHGRVNDYWNPAFGEPRQLKCIQCHDPHQPRSPAMDPLQPLPGPNTLRMGSPGHAEAVVQPHENDPLRRTTDASAGTRDGEKHK